MPAAQDFQNLQAQIQTLYQNGDYPTALELVNRSAAHHPARLPLLVYWQIVLTARLDRTRQALDTLEAALDNGIWYAEVLLRRNPALESLHEAARFSELLERNREIAAEDSARRYPLLTLRPEAGEGPPDQGYPAVLALHANTSSAQAELPFWKPLAESGWLVGVAQSTQALWRGAYVWDDQEYTREEVKRIYDLIHQQYPLDPNHLLLAGLEVGAEAAVWLATSGELALNGVIAVEPDGPLTRTSGAWEELLSRPQLRQLPAGLAPPRACLLAEEPLKPPRLAALQNLDDALNIAGYPAHLELLAPGALSEPRARQQALNAAVNWLLTDE